MLCVYESHAGCPLSWGGVWNRCRLFTHKKTGGEVLSVSVSDENKVFGITFRTPPDDSKGVPHILEHSVLHPAENTSTFYRTLLTAAC